MKIAVTVWGNRVSPVFDAARTLLIATMDHQTIQDQWHTGFDPDNLPKLLALLRAHQIPILICGAISARPAQTLAAGGVKLISFVSGTTLEVVHAIARQRQLPAHHLMPGSPTAP